MRLDFDTFTISGPSTNTISVSKKRDNGGPVSQNAGGDDNPVTNYGQCLTDTFSVGNPNGPSPPSICGVNSGEHSNYYLMCNFKRGKMTKCNFIHFSVCGVGRRLL